MSTTTIVILHVLQEPNPQEDVIIHVGLEAFYEGPNAIPRLRDRVTTLPQPQRPSGKQKNSISYPEFT